MKRLLWGVLLVCSLACAGCGGGGSNSPSGTSNNTGSDESGNGNGTADSGDSDSGATSGAAGDVDASTYLFFWDQSKYLLTALDPENLATKTQVTPPPKVSSDVALMTFGSYDPSKKAFSSLHSRALVYSSEGDIYKVSALKGSSPTATRISNESSTLDFKIDNRFTDFKNFENSWVIYHDGTDEIEKGAIRLGMSPTDSPVKIEARSIDAIYNPDNLSIKGFLVADVSERGKNMLKRFDAVFSSPTSIIEFRHAVTIIGYSPTSSGAWLKIDGSLHFLDFGNNKLSPSYFKFSDEISTDIVYANDGNSVFFADEKKIYSVPSCSPATPVLVADESAKTTYISTIYCTKQNLVYWTFVGNGDKQIKSVAKTGGPTKILTSGSIFIEAVHYESGTVYFDRVSGYDYTPEAAGSVKDDGSGLTETKNAKWAGYAKDSIATWETGLDVPKYLFLATGFDTQYGCYRNGTLFSWNAASNNQRVNLGSAWFNKHFSITSNYGDARLGATSDGNAQNVFYVNAKKAESFAYVTTTDTYHVREYPLN